MPQVYRFPGKQFLGLPEYWNRVILSPAQVKALKSVPQIIVQPNLAEAPKNPAVVITKRPGTAYVNTGNTNLIVRRFSNDGLGSQLLLNFGFAVTLPFATTTVSFANYVSTEIITSGGPTSSSDGFGSYFRIELDTADLVTGDGELIIDTYYFAVQQAIRV